MANKKEASIDDILKSIRDAITDKEQKKFFRQFLPKKKEVEEEEVFELTPTMIVKREDIPYQLGVWSFDDVAKKIMKKYNNFFSERYNGQQNLIDTRVGVKENTTAEHGLFSSRKL